MMFIGMALFALVVAFAMWYFGMRILYELWYGKRAQKLRKEAIDALIRMDELLKEMKEAEENFVYVYQETETV